MNKRYRLGEIEEAVSEMEELIGLEDDIAEIDDDFQIVVSGWSVYVESLNLTLRQGIACVWDAEEGLFMPDFDVTIVYEGNIEKATPEAMLLSLMSQVKVCKHPFLLTHYTMSRMEWLLHLATGLMADCLVNR